MRTTWLRSGTSIVALALAGAAGLGATAAARQAQPDLIKVRVTPALVTILRVPNWVAASEGIYRRNGLDVEQCVPPNDVRDVKRILDVDVPMKHRCTDNAPSPFTIAGGLPTSFMSQFQSAVPPRPRTVILATVQNRTNYTLVARKDITAPEQLRGKRIGITSDFNILGFQALLFARAMGWQVGRDIQLVPNPSGFIEGLEKGEFEAYIVGEGLPAWQAQQAGYTPLLDFGQWKVPMASSSINANAEWLQNNRETARRFIKSMVDAIAVIKQDRQAAYRAMTEYYGITDPTMLEFFYTSWDFPRKPYPAVDGLKTAQVFYDGHPGVRTEALRAAAIDSFVDDSFIRELDESGYIDRLYNNK